MKRKYQLIFLLLASAGGPVEGQMTPQQQQQLPESNPNSAHYHNRYLPALGSSQSRSERLEDRFGAFAMSEGSGWSGWAIDAESKELADFQALEQCRERSRGAQDCEVVISFQNQCGSVVGSKDHSGFGTASTVRRARHIATELCEGIGPGCKVFWEGCSYPMPAE